MKNSILLPNKLIAFRYLSSESSTTHLRTHLNIKLPSICVLLTKWEVSIPAVAFAFKTNFNIQRIIHFWMVLEYFGANCSHRFTICATRTVTQL
jgi:hypothetical protein